MLRGIPALCGVALLAGCASSSGSGSGERVWDARRNPYEFHRGMTYALLRASSAQRAVPHVNELLRLKPKAAEPYYLLGRLYLELRVPGRAEGAMREALKRDANFAPAHGSLGVILDTQRRHREAEQAHRAALKLDDQRASYHNNLGFCLYLQGRVRDAVEAYRLALLRQPTHLRIHNNLAFAYAREGNLHLAYRHFRMGGKPAEAQNNMGFVYEELGELERAYDFYLKALQLDPEHLRVRKNLERICKRLGRPMPSLLSSAREAPGTTPQEDTP